MVSYFRSILCHVSYTYSKSKALLFHVAVWWYGCVFSRVWFFAILWTITLQTPLSMGFSRQEYWSRLPFPPPGNCLNPGIEPASPALAGGFFTTVLPIWCVCYLLSHVWLFMTPWTIAHHAPLSMDSLCAWILQARILEWVASSFSRGSSWPRDWTQVFHIAGRFFTIWVTREA